MKKHTNGGFSLALALERLSKRVTEWAGGSWAFGVAVGVIAVWALTGPFFAFSDTWQLVINTGTTIVTFLMVFLIQRSQNKDAQALHLKLNEIVAALEGASNRLINVEELTEVEVKLLHQHYRTLVAISKAETSLTHSHSIEEATVRHRRKKHAAAAPGISSSVAPVVAGESPGLPEGMPQ
jgi:low affinity Fe/Cu permease